MRRRTVTAICVDQQLVKSGRLWSLDIPAKDMKSKRPIDYPISPELSERIDLYLCRFRYRMPRAAEHDGFWAADKGRPMDDGTIYDMVCRRTTAAFGFAVNLHRFRSASGTFWSIHDPANVRGVRDLLGHASFDPTEKYYIITQSRLAGHTLARALKTIINRPAGS
jgi:integrase/recombinase XerD